MSFCLRWSGTTDGGLASSFSFNGPPGPQTAFSFGSVLTGVYHGDEHAEWRREFSKKKINDAAMMNLMSNLRVNQSVEAALVVLALATFYWDSFSMLVWVQQLGNIVPVFKIRFEQVFTFAWRDDPEVSMQPWPGPADAGGDCWCWRLAGSGSPGKPDPTWKPLSWRMLFNLKVIITVIITVIRVYRR